MQGQQVDTGGLALRAHAGADDCHARIGRIFAEVKRDDLRAALHLNAAELHIDIRGKIHRRVGNRQIQAAERFSEVAIVGWTLAAHDEYVQTR